MTYLISFNMLKSIDDWNSKTGAAGHMRDLDTWQHEIISSHQPTKNTLQKLLEKVGSYLQAKDFFYWPDEDGRFTTSRVEDSVGYPTDKGIYLADYDVRLDCREIKDPLLIGSLGLKSGDE